MDTHTYTYMGSHRRKKPWWESIPIYIILICFLLVTGINLARIDHVCRTQKDLISDLSYMHECIDDQSSHLEAIDEWLTNIEQDRLVSLGEYTITHYCACEKCCGKWANGITATGTVATEGRTIAVDPKVIPYGTHVWIDNHEFIAEDCGGAIRGNKIDIFCETHEDAINRGVVTREVFKIE